MSPPTLSLWLRNIAPIQELEKEEEIKERKGRRVIAFLKRGSSARSLTLHSNEKTLNFSATFDSCHSQLDPTSKCMRNERESTKTAI